MPLTDEEKARADAAELREKEHRAKVRFQGWYTKESGRLAKRGPGRPSADEDRVREQRLLQLSVLSQAYADSCVHDGSVPCPPETYWATGALQKRVCGKRLAAAWRATGGRGRSGCGGCRSDGGGFGRQTTQIRWVQPHNEGHHGRLDDINGRRMGHTWVGVRLDSWRTRRMNCSATRCALPPHRAGSQ